MDPSAMKRFLRHWLRVTAEVLVQGDPRPVRLFSGAGAVAFGVTALSTRVDPMPPVYTWLAGGLTICAGFVLLSRPKALNGATATATLLSSTIYAACAVLVYASRGGWGRGTTIYLGLALTALWLSLRASPIRLRQDLVEAEPRLSAVPPVIVPPPSLAPSKEDALPHAPC
jgi:hypothetical protein